LYHSNKVLYGCNDETAAAAAAAADDDDDDDVTTELSLISKLPTYISLLAQR